MTSKLVIFRAFFSVPLTLNLKKIPINQQIKKSGLKQGDHDKSHCDLEHNTTQLIKYGNCLKLALQCGWMSCGIRFTAALFV